MATRTAQYVLVVFRRSARRILAFSTTLRGSVLDHDERRATLQPPLITSSMSFPSFSLVRSSAEPIIGPDESVG
jgi:hypothetical protein